jgi:hypothetical protein
MRRPKAGPRSDGEAPAALGAASGKHAPSTGGLHPRAEPMFSGAMTLLGLVRLLHGLPMAPWWIRSLCGSRAGSVAHLPGRHGNAPGAHQRVDASLVRRIIWTGRRECQTALAAAQAGPILPVGIPDCTLPTSGSRCYSLAAPSPQAWGRGTGTWRQAAVDTVSSGRSSAAGSHGPPARHCLSR